jgi:ribosome-binding factor A
MARRTHRSNAFGRHLRVGETMRHELAAIFARGEVRDPALDNVSITVTEVRVTPDLHHATAYVLPLGDNQAELVLAGLKRSAGFLRAQLAHGLRLRYMPTLAFAIDRSFAYAEKIDALLKRPEVARDLAAPPAGPSPDDDER